MSDALETLATFHRRLRERADRAHERELVELHLSLGDVEGLLSIVEGYIEIVRAAREARSIR